MALSSAIDPGMLQLMRVSSELMEAQEAIRKQRCTIWALVSALRAERRASTALLDLLDQLLTGDDG